MQLVDGDQLFVKTVKSSSGCYGWGIIKICVLYFMSQTDELHYEYIDSENGHPARCRGSDSCRMSCASYSLRGSI